MEAKENMFPGVTVIRSQTQSNYNAELHAEAPGQVTITPAMTSAPATGDLVGGMEKKKRGRPRKYAADGMVSMVVSPQPISESAPSSSAKLSSGKRGRARSIGPATDLQSRVGKEARGEGAMYSDGSYFTPHVITVNAGEDVTAKIISFCQEGPRAICILSASGVISNATLRQSDSSGGTLTYEGRFEIVNLCGSFTPTERAGLRHRAGGLSISMSSPNGQLVGGCVAGLMVAASPVQIIVGSFLPSNIFHDHKSKKPKAQPTQVSVPGAAGSGKDLGCNGLEQKNSVEMMPNLSSSGFQRESWPVMYGNGQNQRKSSTDINISLPGG